jgi:hypothetical protein
MNYIEYGIPLWKLKLIGRLFKNEGFEGWVYGG